MRVTTLTKPGPVRRPSNRRPPTVRNHRDSQSRWTGCRGPDTTINAFNGVPDSNCLAQVKIGMDKTVTLIDTIFDGTTYVPVTSRTLDLNLTGFMGVGRAHGFTTTNPGITMLTPNHGNLCEGTRARHRVSAP